MTLTALRRTTSTIAVVATTAALAAVPVLDAAGASATDRATTSLSIRTVRPAVRPGGDDTVTGDLAVAGVASAAGRNVTLEAKAKGEDSFTPIAQATTGDRGGVRAAVTPAVTTRYRWHYLGEADARPSVSGTATVRVRTPQHPPTRLPTTLAIRVAHRVVGLGGADVVRGRLRSHRVPIRHRWVILTSRSTDATGWSFEAARRTDRRGAVAFSVHPTERTAYRLAFLGTPLLQRSRSARVHVGIRPQVSISATPRRIDPGGSSTVSGSVTHLGTPLAGATVKLLARRAGTHHRFLLEQTSTTADDGSVSFTVTPDHSTAYRLRVVHSDGVPAAESPRMRVGVRFATSLSIRGLATATAYRVSGILRGHGHPLRHRVVTLLQQAPGGTDWTAVGTTRSGGHGVVHFTEPLAGGTGYRLSYAGGPRFAPGISGTVVNRRVI
jgi:hypothetical protein